MAELVPTAKAEQDTLRTYEDHAAKGDANAAFNCSIMFARGVGCSKDRARALRYLEQAAEGGLPQAMSQLAFLYSSGRGGVGGRDPELALEWYEKAAGLGDAEALYQLGVLKRRSEGVGAARAYWVSAAAAGHAKARERLSKAFGADAAPEPPPEPEEEARVSVLGELCTGLRARVEDLYGRVLALHRRAPDDLDQSLLEGEMTPRSEAL
mmetsp:Transcript_1134/g.3389  ORF Transcript_1134/g.3389 Transcript_1134/m.3389 type:complete len:210 (-) Transcript_1134:37-666(-)